MEAGGRQGWTQYTTNFSTTHFLFTIFRIGGPMSIPSKMCETPRCTCVIPWLYPTGSCRISCRPCMTCRLYDRSGTVIRSFCRITMLFVDYLSMFIASFVSTLTLPPPIGTARSILTRWRTGVPCYSIWKLGRPCMDQVRRPS